MTIQTPPRLSAFFCSVLFALAIIPSEGFSQGTSQQPTVEVQSPAEGAPDSQRDWDFLLSLRSRVEEKCLSDTLRLPDDFYEKFQTPKKPPISLEDTGDRVEELQATLNQKLGSNDRDGRIVQLGKTIFVGPARGKMGAKEKEKVRIVWVQHRDMAFQIRGDWIPLDSKGKNVSDEDGADFYEDLKPTQAIRLPNEPLKVKSDSEN